MYSYKLTFANIVKEAMEAVRDSDEVQQWCVSTYGTAPCILNDTDIMNPPNESECPLVSILAIGGSNGQDEGTYTRGFIVRVALSDNETVEERDETTGRLLWRTYKGTERVSHFLEDLIYPAIRERFNSLGFPVSTEDEELETVNMTLFQAKSAMSVSMDKTIGEERPLLG